MVWYKFTKKVDLDVTLGRLLTDATHTHWFLIAR